MSVAPTFDLAEAWELAAWRDFARLRWAVYHAGRREWRRTHRLRAVAIPLVEPKGPLEVVEP